MKQYHKMAAIDKMYVHSYYEYDDLRRWAIVYYPELLFHFYDITMDYQQWEDNCRSWVEKNISTARRDYERLGEFENENDAVVNKRNWYREVGIEVPLHSIIESVHYTIEAYNRTTEDWENLYSCPIMNTPFKVDKKLLWICPVPCVRKYLEEQCGYRTKWYYKLFWKGKKTFLI